MHYKNPDSCSLLEMTWLITGVNISVSIGKCILQTAGCSLCIYAFDTTSY